MTKNWYKSINQPKSNWCLKALFTSNRTVEKAINSAVINHKDGLLAL